MRKLNESELKQFNLTEGIEVTVVFSWPDKGTIVRKERYKPEIDAYTTIGYFILDEPENNYGRLSLAWDAIHGYTPRLKERGLK